MFGVPRSLSKIHLKGTDCTGREPVTCYPETQKPTITTRYCHTVVKKLVTELLYTCRITCCLVFWPMVVSAFVVSSQLNTSLRCSPHNTAQ